MLPTFEPYLLIPAAVLLSVLLFLAIPVTISFSVVRREALSGRITIGWLFGLLQFTPSKSRGTGRTPKKRRPAADGAQPDDDSPGKTPSAAPRTAAKRFKALLKSKGFMRGVLKCTHGMATRVRFVSLRIAGRFGLGNPYDTGRLWGYICAFTGFLHGADRVRLLVEPEFDEAILEFDGEGELRVVPVTLFWPAARFVLSPATLRAAWTAATRR